MLREEKSRESYLTCDPTLRILINLYKSAFTLISHCDDLLVHLQRREMCEEASEAPITNRDLHSANRYIVPEFVHFLKPDLFERIEEGKEISANSIAGPY